MKSQQWQREKYATEGGCAGLKAIRARLERNATNTLEYAVVRCDWFGALEKRHHKHAYTQTHQYHKLKMVTQILCGCLKGERGSRNPSQNECAVERAEPEPIREFTFELVWLVHENTRSGASLREIISFASPSVLWCKVCG